MEVAVPSAAPTTRRPRRRKHKAKTTPATPAPAGGPGPRLWGDQSDPAAVPEVAGGIVRDNVRATYHYYAQAGYETATLACADRFWADPDYGRKLLKYPWTAYCLDKGDVQKVCGRCLRVTNRRTGASAIARAVDKGGCSDRDGTGLDLDPAIFTPLDTDGRGYADGFMRVDVREVDCGPDGTFS
jgi:hypothetical protein